MIQERIRDDIERDPAQYFRRYNAEAPERGGAQKEVAWHQRETILALRKAWEQSANLALGREGLDIRIDHRSLTEQARDLQPERLRAALLDTERDLSQVRTELAREQHVQMMEQARTQIQVPLRHQQAPQRVQGRSLLQEMPITRTRGGKKLAPKLDPERERDIERELSW
jgi:hypothetical protein